MARPENSACESKIGQKSENDTELISTSRLAEDEGVASAPKQAGKRLCSSMTRKGTPCTQHCWNNTNKCLLHQPGYAASIGRRGGLRRARYDPKTLTPFAAPTSASEQARILAQLQVETHQGLIDPKTASCISTLANAYLNALELIEFGEKLKDLERRVGITSDPLDSNVATGGIQ